MTDSPKSRIWKQIESKLSQPLTDSEIHICCASLNVSQAALSYHTTLLSPDEKTRAERFYFERDRDHYVVGRGLLRTLIGHYLKMDPSRIEFAYEDYGKPALKSVLGDKSFEFNLSHAQDLALYAFRWNHKVGIDVEYVRPMPDMDDFAERFFSTHESAFINSLSGKQKEIAFFKLWTCKEAFLKAKGNGLTLPLNQVEISLETADSVMLESINEEKDQNVYWHFKMFNPLAGYQAALAFEDQNPATTKTTIRSLSFV